MNKDIIEKIKANAYENVNKKIQEEKEKTENKIKYEIDVVEEILKYIQNKMLFKINDNGKYELVDEKMFFEDYNCEPKYDFQKGISIKHKREKKWDEFIKVNGNSYYDIRYIIRHYEERFNNLEERLYRLKDTFSEIEETAKELKKEEPNIKKLIEKYKKIDIEEETNEKVD